MHARHKAGLGGGPMTGCRAITFANRAAFIRSLRAAQEPEEMVAVTEAAWAEVEARNHAPLGVIHWVAGLTGNAPPAGSRVH